MKSSMLIVIPFVLLVTCWSLELTEDAYICYAPDSSEYGNPCEAPLKLTGGHDVFLNYTVKITKPDKQRVWCEGKAYFMDKDMKVPEAQWYLLGGGIDTYSHLVPWNDAVKKMAPSVRCRSLGDDPHIVEYKAEIKDIKS